MFAKQLLLFFLIVFYSNVKGQDLGAIGKQKPFKFSGGIGVFADGYAVQGIAPRSTPFNWRVTGSPTISVFGMSFPFYFNIGSQQRSFTQPFNQYGVSPKYKWITAHLGWRNLAYSQYTLSGLVFYGAALEINPGKFRFSAMYGRFSKAVREDTTQQFIQAIPAFKRTGFGGRIGFGTTQNFLDFIFFKAKDDSTSYADHPQRVKPAENAVFGINTKLLLFKHLSIGIDAAISGYTRDIRLDSLSDPAIQRFAPVLKVNISTQLLTAANASIGYVSKFFALRFQYRRLDQDYKSMGAYLYQTDLESFTVEPSFNILKNKVRVSGSFGKQSDNLSRSKMVSNLRTIGSAAVSLNISRTYGLDLQYGNYGVAQRAGVVPLNDTIRMAIANQNFNVVNRFSFINKKRAINTILLTTYQELTNLNPLFPAFIESKVMLGNLSVNYSVISSGITINAGYNYSDSRFALGKIIASGPIAGIGKTFFKNKLSTSLNASFLKNSFNSVSNGITLTSGFNLNYRLNKSNSFLANFRITRNTSSSPVAVPFTEAFFSAGYQFILH